VHLTNEISIWPKNNWKSIANNHFDTAYVKYRRYLHQYSSELYCNINYREDSSSCAVIMDTLLLSGETEAAENEAKETGFWARAATSVDAAAQPALSWPLRLRFLTWRGFRRTDHERFTHDPQAPDPSQHKQRRSTGDRGERYCITATVSRPSWWFWRSVGQRRVCGDQFWPNNRCCSNFSVWRNIFQGFRPQTSNSCCCLVSVSFFTPVGCRASVSNRVVYFVSGDLFYFVLFEYHLWVCVRILLSAKCR